MTNTAIKLMWLIVLLSCIAPSAYGIGFGASINGVSTHFDVEGDKSSIISGGFTLDSMTLEPVFSGSNVKKFAHTYKYPDSAGNKAILSVDLEKAKKVYLAVSPATGFAEASETLSVKDADLIKTGAKAVTSEGDTASVDLNIVGGSLDGYVNYANANLINELGDKTFVAWQSADVISGTTIESSSQAIYAAEDTFILPVAQVNSNILVTNGQIYGLYSDAGKNTYFESWSDGYNSWSHARKELYANQSASAISKIASKGKKPSPLVMNFASETSATDSDGNTAAQKTSAVEATLNSYSSEARVSSDVYLYSEGSHSGSGTSKGMSIWQNAGSLNANSFETQILSADIDGDTASLTTSILDGTINDYGSGVESGSGSSSSTYGDSGIYKSKYTTQYAKTINASGFETQRLASDADGNMAGLTTSILNGTSNGYSSGTGMYSGSYSSADGYSGIYKDKSAHQYAGTIDAGDFESYASATDKDGNSADNLISILDGTGSGYSSNAVVHSSSHSNSYGDSNARKGTNAGQYAHVINAGNSESHSSATDKDGNSAGRITSILGGTSNGYMSGAEVYSESYSNSNGDSGTNSWTNSVLNAGTINALNFATILTASSICGSESIASLHVTDAYLENLYAHATVSKDSEFGIPDIEARNYAGFVSGSLIRAEGSSHDQSGNAANATMQLESTDTANAAIRGYDQESHTTSPSSIWGYPATIAWIRAETSATGNGIFTAEATNGTVTATLPTTITLDGTTFANFGRVKEGTPVAYFVMPDPGVYPWEYNP